MSPLGSAVARWMATLPGPIYGATEDECYQNALDASSILGVTNDIFKAALDRAGYNAQERRTGWVLALPERGPGSR